MPIQVFPLTGGMNQQYDVRLLPDGVLSNAVNCEMERVGRVVGRARFQSLGTGVLSAGAGALVAYDLVTFLDRLFAVGDDTRFGVPANFYEYLGSGTAQPWRPTSPVADLVPRLGQTTRVRDIARPPDQGTGAVVMSGAVLAGFAALSWNAGTKGYFCVVRAASDQLIFCALLDNSGNQPSRRLRVVALSDRFIIVGLNSAQTKVSISKFTPATDTAIASLATDVFSSSSINTNIGVCKVTGADQFMIVIRSSTSIKVRRFDNAGTVIVPSGGQYADIAGSTSQFSKITVEASSTANQVTVAFIDDGECQLYSYNLGTGAAIGTGPFTPFTGEDATDVTLVRDSLTTVQVLCSIPGLAGAEDVIKANRYTVSSNTFAGAITAVTDAALTTHAGYDTATGAFLFGVRVGLGTVGNSPNILCSWLLTNAGSRFEIVKDLETAGVADDSGSATAPLADLAFDATNSKWYWCNGSADPDGSLAPKLTEFSYGSTFRRQTAEFGGHLYITGGAPLVFDGTSLVESGFQLRPRIISVTPGTIALFTGLVLGGTYKYRLHWEWTDSKGDLHLSPPSAITETTLSGTENKAVVKASGPHSWRRSVGAGPGSAVIGVLSRTLATATQTPAIVIGTTSINPPSSSLNGLTLKITAGGSSFTVTFDGSATTQATVLSEINAVVSSEVTATAPGGVLVLTSVDEGDGATIQITNGTANTILGLTEGETEVGTTDRTVGENFQRAGTDTAEVTEASAVYLSITDFRIDESDPIVDSDLIRQQVLYSQGVASGAHHAPPPSEFVAAGRERLIWSGQPRRSRYTATKLIVTGEPAECAAEGFLQYSGQITGDIEAGYVLGDTLVFWTRNQTWTVAGSGPNRAGTGEFFAAQCVNKRVGIIADGWRSLVEDEQGVWFQGQDAELYHVGRGGDVTWRGKAVREYLKLYPVITAACARGARQEVAFAVTNAAGNAGGILRFRSDPEAWMFDDVGAVTSLVNYQGRLAYVQAGGVYLQDAAPGSGTFPTFYLDSGMFQGFQALGYGALQELGVLATFRGRCTIKLKIGTDGTTFPDTIASWALTSSEYSVGQRVQLLVDAPQQEYDSFALRAEVSDVTGTTEGAWLHAFAVKSESQPDFVRLAPSRRL